ncbi:hypothetical protein [Ornithinimicrobium cerasi]|uniref:hypothetical protein n=1 Tax=Ornithinimicrobium cerasi TaxID=2248773 RepID=UPI001F2C6458|nr:hypothetical protein [Ornithinimicrobium cerasi]
MFLGKIGDAPRRARGRAPAAAGAVLALVLLAGCETDGAGRSPDGTAASDGVDPDGSDRGGEGNGQEAPQGLVASLAVPGETLVVTGAASERSVGVARALFASAPVVVLASAEEQLRAASAGAALGVPVLVDGVDTAAELERLGTEVVLALGEVADPGLDVVVPPDDAALARLLGTEPETVSAEEALGRLSEVSPGSPALLVPAAADSTPDGDEEAATVAPPDDASSTSGTPGPTLLASDLEELPPTAAPEPVAGTVVLTAGDDEDLGALGSARAAGATVVRAEGGDPRATGESVQALAGAAPQALIGLGEEFVDAETLAWRSRVAATGVELPGGGQLVLPDKTYVALYGTPGSGALGVLGEQPEEETVTRAEELAAAYAELTDEPVIPTLEIIATIASSEAGPDGNYSTERSVEELRPLVELAGEHGMYVVLDLQPGRTDFVTQARIYEDLLRLPHVGLALDPEWRLRDGEVHLVQIGQVDVSEVDEVVTYLADLTRENDLPQKVLVLHQFQIRMLPGVNDVDQSRSELAVLIHVDGQGAQPDKQATWRSLLNNAPEVEHWGWKNFYDEDIPGPLSPEETMSLVEPTPDFISYQ